MTATHLRQDIHRKSPAGGARPARENLRPWRAINSSRRRGTRERVGARLGGWAAALLLLAACGVKKPADDTLLDQPTDPCARQANQQQLLALMAGRRQESADGVDYVLASGDLILVTIYNYRPEGGDFSSEVRVDDRGYVSLPMTDPVRAAGRSLAEVRGEIISGLRRAEVMREPLIGVFLKEYQGQEVIVLGAVGKPGLYHLSRGRQTLADVLSMAGGLSQAAGNHVLLRPGGTAAGDLAGVLGADAVDLEQRPGMLAVCLDSNGSGANPEALGLSVRGGDMVVVPESGQAFIEGEVEKPGLYPLTRGVTITQFISGAGGLKYPADRKRVKLIRNSGGGSSTEWEVDLDEIAARSRPDVLLVRNDRVVVGSTAGKKVAYGVYNTITGIVRVTLGGAATIF